eukprot:760894_1
MGASCNSFCSKERSVYHTQPDTESMKSRSNNSYISSQSDTSTPVGSVPNTSYKDELIKEFYESITQGNENMVMFYISEYPDMNLQDTKFKNNDPAIHVAIKHRKYKVIQCLLEHDASINAQNITTGDSALHLAARIGDITCIDMLIQNGANANITNNYHETALDIANEYKYVDIIHKLSRATNFIKLNDGNSTPVTSKMMSFANCLLEVPKYDDNGKEFDTLALTPPD